MAKTVTVRRKGTRFIVVFSALPHRTFGPWSMPEVVRDLRISALLSPLDARELVLQAATDGTATTVVGE